MEISWKSWNSTTIYLDDPAASSPGNSLVTAFLCERDKGMSCATNPKSYHAALQEWPPVSDKNLTNLREAIQREVVATGKCNICDPFYYLTFTDFCRVVH